MFLTSPAAPLSVQPPCVALIGLGRVSDDFELHRDGRRRQPCSRHSRARLLVARVRELSESLERVELCPSSGTNSPICESASTPSFFLPLASHPQSAGCMNCTGPRQPRAADDSLVVCVLGSSTFSTFFLITVTGSFAPLPFLLSSCTLRGKGFHLENASAVLCLLSVSVLHSTGCLPKSHCDIATFGSSHSNLQTDVHHVSHHRYPLFPSSKCTRVSLSSS